MANITAWVKKVWKDRKTEYPTRRTLTKTNGSQEIVTVARNEGNVSQEGDAFSAANMNDLEERIDAGFTALTGKLGKKAEQGKKVYFSSIEFSKEKDSLSPPYIYVENNDGNIYFRYKNTNGELKYTNIKYIVEAIELLLARP